MVGITISQIVTLIVFGAIGTFFGSDIKTKPGTPWLVSLALFIVVSQWILIGTRVIDVFGFQIFANQMLQALACGLLIGLLTKRAKQAQPTS